MPRVQLLFDKRDDFGFVQWRARFGANAHHGFVVAVEQGQADDAGSGFLRFQPRDIVPRDELFPCETAAFGDAFVVGAHEGVAQKGAQKNRHADVGEQNRRADRAQRVLLRVRLHSRQKPHQAARYHSAQQQGQRHHRQKRGGETHLDTFIYRKSIFHSRKVHREEREGCEEKFRSA